MKVIDLTHTIHSNMPVFPKTEPPVFKVSNTHKKDGFMETKLSMYSHTGTHIDAPRHMLSKGSSLDELSIDRYIGKSTVLDFSKLDKEYIEINDLSKYKEKIAKVEFIILKTGWSKYWGEKEYFLDFPSLSIEAANYLKEFNLKGIGIDTISIDKIDSESFVVHKILLSKDILIIENLTNLDNINSEYFILSILPLKTLDADGSPVRAVAIKNKEHGSFK
ncbi:MAG: cyclase family protein [Firmicutes bacterium]|nr:cyclase family protein [Bacillota bacterium]